jgi:uncharacterized circularly permuted ATP-grasp superfamily protein
VSRTPPPLAGYPASAADEVLDADGHLRADRTALAGVLELGPRGLADAATSLAAAARERDLVLGTWSDGRQVVRPVTVDPVPRVVPAAEWRVVAAGAAQRHRALLAFLADTYRAAGRRRTDPDRAPAVVRAGVLPEWAVAGSPGREPQAVGYAWAGQPRAALAACDVVRTADGRWLATADHLREPAGLALAVTARALASRPGTALLPGVPVADPASAVGGLRAALEAAAPPACDGSPCIAVLTAGDADAAEHRLLAEALRVPLVAPLDLWPQADGGITATVDGARAPVDVLYRRFPEAELAAHRTPAGPSLAALLLEGVRSGRLGLANVPGNGLADDAATFPWVPELIRFYLGEEPLLDSVRTWVLADEGQWAQVRDRLHELVVEPVSAYGGGGTVVGPECSAGELAMLEAEVAAAPHRFVAREVAVAGTVPTVDGGRPVPRPVDLRVFTAAAADGTVTPLPAPLTRVAADVGWIKDTWLLSD